MSLPESSSPLGGIPHQAQLRESAVQESKNTFNYAPVILALGIITVLGGVFLALAAHQILPFGVNALSNIAVWGQVMGYGCIGLGALTSLLAGVKWHLSRKSVKNITEEPVLSENGRESASETAEIKAKESEVDEEKGVPGSNDEPELSGTGGVEDGQKVVSESEEELEIPPMLQQYPRWLSKLLMGQCVDFLNYPTKTFSSAFLNASAASPVSAFKMRGVSGLGLRLHITHQSEDNDFVPDGVPGQKHILQEQKTEIMSEFDSARGFDLRVDIQVGGSVAVGPGQKLDLLHGDIRPDIWHRGVVCTARDILGTLFKFIDHEQLTTQEQEWANIESQDDPALRDSDPKSNLLWLLLRLLNGQSAKIREWDSNILVRDLEQPALGYWKISLAS